MNTVLWKNLELSFFDAWFMALQASQFRQMQGLADNEGIDCIALKREIIQEMKANGKLPGNSSA